MAESTPVPTSNSIATASLNLNATIEAVRQTVVGIWELAPTTETPPAPEAVESHDMVLEKRAESVVGDDDGRTLVNPKDFGPGGKYRSIVKLLCHHEFQKPGSWMQGTGWLIKPDLLVTAGHCTYDWGHKFGRVVEVKAYIGYDGRQNLSNPNVQFRHVSKVVCPVGWLAAKGAKARDVGFMKLDKPFEGVKPISFGNTPPSSKANIGVVGYPGDKEDARTHEKGAHMYEMFEETEWNLTESKDTMLQYKIDTYGGNSGSPVLIRDSNTSIGAHVYGGSVESFNAASVIGKYGNVYEDFVKAFDLPIPKDNALHIVPIPNTSILTTSTPVGASANALRKAIDSHPTHHHHPAGNRLQAGGEGVAPRAVRKMRSTQRLPAARGVAESDEEGFMEIFKKAIKIGAPVVGGVLKAGLPIALGPVGGPIGALAGMTLNAAAKFAESAEADGTEAVATDGIHHGALERAILAEAALATLQKTNFTHEEEESIFSDMKDTVMKSLPTIKKVATRVLPAMMEPALRIALHGLQEHNKSMGAEGFGDEPEGLHDMGPYPAEIDHPTANRQAELFLRGLQNAAVPPGAESSGEEEGFMDIIKTGLRLGGQGLSFAAKHGLPLLAQGLSAMAESDEVGGAESTIAGPSGLLSTDSLACRAIVSDAALSAVMKLPPKRLEEEGFFDSVFDIVKKIAPVAAKVAPIVLDNVHPIAGSIARKVLNQESAAADDDGSYLRQRNTGFGPALEQQGRFNPTGFLGNHSYSYSGGLRKQKSMTLPRRQPAANFIERAGKFSGVAY